MSARIVSMISPSSVSSGDVSGRERGGARSRPARSGRASGGDGEDGGEGDRRKFTWISGVPGGAGGLAAEAIPVEAPGKTGARMADP
jgi:hypothetical protein